MTPAEARVGSVNQQALKAGQGKELDKALDAKRKALAMSEADFHTMLASQRIRWAKEEREHGEEVDRREREISVLEEKKRKALIPIEQREKEANNLWQEARQEKQKAIDKQSECDKTQEVMEQRIDEASEEKERLAEFANTLYRKQLGIDLQEVHSKENAQRVSERMETLRVEGEKFANHVRGEEKKLADREEAADKRDAAQDRREESLEERETQVYIRELMTSSPVRKL